MVASSIYQGLLAGNSAPAQNPVIPTPHTRRRCRSRRELTPIFVPTRLRSRKNIHKEVFSYDEEKPLNLLIPELPTDHPPIQTQEPFYIDPTPIKGFIPGQKRVEGNSIEVRAKFVWQRITEENSIPQIPDPGSSFTAFQEGEKRNKVQNDHNSELTRA